MVYVLVPKSDTHLYSYVCVCVCVCVFVLLSLKPNICESRVEFLVTHPSRQ